MTVDWEGIGKESVKLLEFAPKWPSLRKEIIGGLLWTRRYITFLGSSQDAMMTMLESHIREREGISHIATNSTIRGLGNGNTRFNRKYWTEDLDVRDPKNPAAAIRNVFDRSDPFIYRAFCTDTCGLAVLGGILSAHEKGTDKEEYEKWFRALVKDNPLGLANDGQGVIHRTLHNPWHDWIPGDWGWIKNQSGHEDTEGGEGKNIIYVGRGLFSGGYRGDKGVELREYLKYVWSWGWKEIGVPFSYEQMRTSYRDSPRGGLSDARDVPRIMMQ